jgi:hypothetical protein
MYWLLNAYRIFITVSKVYRFDPHCFSRAYGSNVDKIKFIKLIFSHFLIW